MGAALQEVAVGDHVVQFYERDSEVVATVGRYLAAAARAGEAAVVIATEAHRLAFESELEAADIDVAAARRNGRFVSIDAAATLARFMNEGRVDPELFHEVVGGIVREAAKSGRPIRAFGEMVALLWDAGEVAAAIELETLWSDLAREVSFSLVCAYPARSVSGSEHFEALQHVCHLHSSVLDSPLLEVKAEFGAQLDSPRATRRFVVDSLRSWGHSGEMLDDAAIVSSELAANAVAHACSPFSVTLSSEDSVVRVSVHDTGSRHGMPVQAGHGLSMVAALASSWGVEALPEGKVVWAELDVTG
jgi:hypothetical protein